ncbi:hypothetical protein ACFQT0_24085 [Hymenobacter humi]|uniref:Uncharacterized protein n=1 Tax=Hymenobacter humi TaxID=1411620 RepID=A0ABW2U9D9_9BACT
MPALPAPAPELADEFADQLPALRSVLLRDASAILASDPAAKGLGEIITRILGFTPRLCTGWPTPCTSAGCRACPAC